VLELRANQFQTVPAEITKLTALTKLDLSHNKISELLPELHILTNLVVS